MPVAIVERNSFRGSISEDSAFGVTGERDFFDAVDQRHTADEVFEAGDLLEQVLDAAEEFRIDHDEDRFVAQRRRRIRADARAAGQAAAKHLDQERQTKSFVSLIATHR